MITVQFPPPAKVLTLNQREHWAPRSQRTKAWRTAACDQARMDKVPRQTGRCVVGISIPVHSMKVRRDGHNWVSTQKAAIDGLVDSGVLRDDSTGYVLTVEPSFHLRSENPNVILTIEALETT